MILESGCYCVDVRYVVEGDPVMKAQCHRRECQYITGGSPSVLMALPASGYEYTKGSPSVFFRDDLKNAVTREFCGRCGTHLVMRPAGHSMVLLKVGTLDEPSCYEGPQAAIFMIDRKPFHQVPNGVPQFARMPQG